MSAEGLRQEIFFLAYHLHWPHSEIMDLPAIERRQFVKLLAQQIERENAQIETARNG
jgi:hypothetical protein